MLTLSPSELHNLTGYRLREKQAEWLLANGVPFRRDDHGRIVVLSKHAEQWVSGVELTASSGPRLDMVR